MDVELVFFDDVGLFVVQQFNISVVWEVGDLEIVIWDVVGIDGVLVNCSVVDIYLFKDGGFIYLVLLVQGVFNDGEQEIFVLFELMSMVRIQVVVFGSIFYDILDEDFEIQLLFSLIVLMAFIFLVQVLCNDESVMFEIFIILVVGFFEMLNLLVIGFLDGVMVIFSVNLVGVNVLSIFIINNLVDVVLGVYEFFFMVVSFFVSKSIEFILDVVVGVFVVAIFVVLVVGV